MVRILLILSVATGLYAQVYKVGFAQDTLANDWRQAQVGEAIQTAAKYDFIDLDVTDASGSIAKQVLHIEEFIVDGYDYIITSPADAKIATFVIDRAMDSGIDVVLISRGIEGDNYTSFIAPDNYKIGQEAAHFLLQKIEYSGTVLMLQGVEGATTTAERTDDLWM